MENNHLEDKIGRTSLILVTVVFFLDLSPKGKETKAMINKLDTYLILRGFPGSSVVKNPPRKKKIHLPSKRSKFTPWFGKITC